MAAKKKAFDMKAAMVETAKQRAQIAAYLNNHPGEHTVAALADALGISTQSLYARAHRMAMNGIIDVSGDPGRPVSYSALGTGPKAVSEEPKIKRSYSRKTHAVDAKEIELVMSGFQIILGKNPATGRLRITLEES